MASQIKPIMDACKVIIDALAISGLTCVIRKTDSVLKVDTLPVLVIWPQEFSGEEWAACGSISGTPDYGTVGRQYAVGFTLDRGSNALVQTNGDDEPNMVKLIQQALNKPTLSGASEVWDSQLVDFMGFEDNQFAQGNEVIKFGMIFTTTENRNG